MKKVKPLWRNIKYNDDDILFLADQLNVTKRLSKILINTGFNTDNYDNFDRFVNPKIRVKCFHMKGILFR